jgi:hypothetical protein
MGQKKIDKEGIIFFLKNNKPFLAKEFGVNKIALLLIFLLPLMTLLNF